ncbi:MAG TPA: glycosyltransferase [Candidatus Binatia bacterium]|nr:glycosyltransferase [Candidatus Binatia bacterium]
MGEPPPRPASILVVSNHGRIVGGGELSLMDLLRGLDRDRWAPALVVPEEGGVASGGRDLGLPVHVIPLPTLRRPGSGVVRSVRALGRLARATGAALIHANGSRAMAYGGVAGRLAGRPAIWHVRIAESDGLVDRALCALATEVIATSRAVARRVAWAPEKIRLVPNGIDLARFTPRPPSGALRAALGVPPSAPVALSIGRHVAEKGYRHLLDAAARIERTKPGVHWILVGDGELRSELLAQSRRLGLESRVHFTGWRDDIPDLLALCDVFVLPSESEGFGRVLVEAMAMTRAVVATAVGGVPEIVRDGETGLLVEPAAPAPLADAVRVLLDDPGRAARLGAAGRARTESTFTLRAHVDAVERVYAGLLGDGRAGG